VVAHAHKPDFVCRRNGRVHLNRRGRQFSRLLAAEVCGSAFIVGSNVGYAMFRGSVKSTGYPLHSPVSPSLPLPCVTVCHHISTGVYQRFSPGPRHIHPFHNTASFYSEGLLAPRPTPNWRANHCRLSATAYAIYSQLPSILEAVPATAT
jgi:hypothetical protein